jgi:hypothetical protein
MRTSRRALLSQRATAPLPSVFRPEKTVTDGATTLSPRCLGAPRPRGTEERTGWGLACLSSGGEGRRGVQLISEL